MVRTNQTNTRFDSIDTNGLYSTLLNLPVTQQMAANVHDIALAIKYRISLEVDTTPDPVPMIRMY